ncbi:MAG TPA: Ppx/GppA phosphatase family protein [Lautropia sp.]|jgi:exopolyphosphatase/guanosine-5'-triphosphate,3'-diphosphate pyrophosphatase|nr:Ppx/GppA phosphatase family protein [Lautropia sp.]
MLQPAIREVVPSSDVRRQLASVDLGSNSFRLMIVEVDESPAGPQMRLLDEIKENVRLGAGLDHHRELSSGAQQRALEALRRFAERLRGLNEDSVRAVATNTVRVARNGAAFLKEAGKALGYPIEVIAGREEARLIYVGAAHSLPQDHKLRLIVDIGGGSTECIIGVDHEPKRRESFQMGCVALTQDFFHDGRITRGAFRKARLQCGELLAAQVKGFRSLGWSYAVGTSGTTKVLWQVGAAEFGYPHITRESLAAMEAMALRAGSASALQAQGLKPERQAVFCAGLAVMQAVFEEFRIDSMVYCDSALREGILYDLLGRASGTDRREITISHLVERYRLDDRHGRQVAAAAEALLTALQGDKPDPHQSHMLAWAARIAEIGSFIAHADAHKHGCYIVANADLPGFSGAEQRLLSFLVLGQSGGLRKLRPYDAEPSHWLLLLCLRVAVILQRRRDGRPTPIRILPTGSGPANGWRIELQQQWAAEHPLTNQSLQKEVEQWRDSAVFKQVGYTLT